jgi:hypothetical protein
MRRVVSLALLGASVLVSACATTTFESSWRNPDAQPVSAQGKKVLALFISEQESRRRTGEAALARELTARGAIGVPAYTMFQHEQMRDTAMLRQRLAAEGFEGVVAMRVVDRRQEQYTSPGYYSAPMYGSFYGYYGYGWGAVYSPGYTTTETIFSVETMVFSIPQNKLIWAGVSETVNPTRMDEFIAELADAVGNEMRKQGLLR